MVQLQAEVSRLEAAGIQIAAISYDSPEVLADFAKRASITYPLLSDQDSKTIEAYGIKNEDVPADSRQAGIPHPGTFLIDQEKTIRAKLFYSVRRRHTPQQLLDAMKSVTDQQ